MVTNGSSTYRGFSLAAATMAAAASLGLAGAASAATIYSDNFVQTVGTQMNGQVVQSSATYAGGTAGATWTGDTNVTTTGTNGAYFGASVNGGPNGTSDLYLPFAPVAGYNYTLTETLSLGTTTATNNNGWLAAGFAPSPSTATSTGSGGGYFYNAKADWALVRPAAGGAPQYFGGPGTANNGSLGTAADSGTQTLVITLNTSAAKWTASAMIQGDPSHPSSTFTYATNPTITDVALGAWSDPGTISQFSLTATSSAVPEPSALFLAAGGAVGAMLLMKRRARSASR